MSTTKISGFSLASGGTEAVQSAGIQDQLRRGRMSGMPGAVEQAQIKADAGGSTATNDEDAGMLATDSLKGTQGTQGSEGTEVESPVIVPTDRTIIDGEGNMQSAASDVNSLEGGTIPGAGDGGDNGGTAVTMDYNPPAPGEQTLESPGNPSQDGEAVQVQSAGMDEQGQTRTDMDGGSITPPDADTTLRAPTAVSPEIGGRITDGEQSQI